MNDALEPLQLVRLIQHPARETGAIDGAVDHGAGKGGFDQRRRGAAIERVDGGIGVMHRDALRPEHRGGRGLAHPDRAGEAENEGHVSGAAGTPSARA